jgi:hypothetical protein
MERSPSVGDATTAILSKMLGFSDAAIEELYEGNIVHRTEPCTTPQIEALNP